MPRPRPILPTANAGQSSPRRRIRLHSAIASPGRRAFIRVAGAGALSPWILSACGGSDDGNDGPTYAATIAAGRAAIEKALATTDTPSVSVALVDRAGPIWAEAFGYIDLAPRTAPTVDTLFSIGSCSKVVAAVAAMMLAERGAIDLDQPVDRYVRDFHMASPGYMQVTVRMLLDHACGFPGTDYRNSVTYAPFPEFSAQMLDALTQSRLKHAPGEMSVYCNDGFSLVEHVVRAVSGISYPQFVAREILAPLRMKTSRYALAAFPAGSYAPGFVDSIRQPQVYPNVYASGGLYTTPLEFGRLLQLLMNGGEFDGVRLLSRAAVAEMGRNQTLAEPLRPVLTDDGFGLGWDGVREGGFAAVGVTCWHKSGGVGPYVTQVMVLPDEGLALTITGTSDTYDPFKLSEQILLDALAERGSIAAVPAPLPPVVLPPAAPTATQLAEMAGIWGSYNGLLQITADASGSLQLAKWDGQVWARQKTLRLRTDGTFASDTEPNRAYRSVMAMGARYLIQRGAIGLGHYLVENPAAQKLPERPPLTPAWQTRVGRQWLMVNERADSDTPLLAYPVFTLGAATGLPGYVLADVQVVDATGDDQIARMCLKIPINNGRDLNDLEVIRRDGEEWLRFGSTVFRPRNSVPMLTAAVTIGPEGYAEWRRLSGAARVSIVGASAWKAYDTEVNLVTAGTGSGSTGPLAAGSYLLLYGTPGTTIALNAVG